MPPLSEQPEHWENTNWTCLSKIIAECLSCSPSSRLRAPGLKDVLEKLSAKTKIHQKEHNQASQDTVSISSSFESRPNFDLSFGDDDYESEVIHDNLISNEKLKKCYEIDSDECKMTIKDLGISQDTPMTTLGCLSLSVPVPKYPFDSYKTFLKIAETVSSLSDLEIIFDATNACTWLCVEICTKRMEQMSIEVVAEKVREIIFENPRTYNKVRDSSKYYSVNEVLFKTKLPFSAFDYVNLDFFTGIDDNTIENNICLALKTAIKLETLQKIH